jgi:TonB family protein
MKAWAKRVAVLTSVLAVASLGLAQTRQETPILDKEIKVVDWAELKYPLPAHWARSEGAVVVKATLDDHGQVIEATAISGSEHFVPDCLANAKKWRFEPNPQKTVVLVYVFSLDGVCHDNQLSSHTVFHRPNLLSIIGCTGVTVP